MLGLRPAWSRSAGSNSAWEVAIAWKITALPVALASCPSSPVARKFVDGVGQRAQLG
jgi:hypothetical protein